MAQVMEFSGRLSRSDKRPANPGSYDLRFGIHASVGDDDPLWEEIVRGVDVVPGGFFHVVLGRSLPLEAVIFEELPRWVSVRVVHGRSVDEENGPRVPVTGLPVLLGHRLRTLESRMGVEPPVLVDEGEDRIQVALRELEERLESLENETEALDLGQQLRELQKRLAELDGEEGRLVHIEDELEDLVGPDGDVVDLNERMDQLEGRAPELIEGLRQREAETSRERVTVIRKEVDELSNVVAELRKAVSAMSAQVQVVASRPLPTADALGVVSRQGDVMTGGLTINRGGLEVLSGGVTCRGATVNSLEAHNLVKAPKVIADALELRGDFTVDNSHRVVQVRLIEGRQGSARKDGALHLNTRGGAEVVVGNAEEARGLQVFGPLSGGSLQVEGTGLAQAFDVYGSIEPGQVVCMRPEGNKVEHSREPASPAVIGVCVASAGLALGGGTIGGRSLVALQGVSRVRVSPGPEGLRTGELLVSGPDGVALPAPPLPAPGTVLGKVLGTVEPGGTEALVLISVR